MKTTKKILAFVLIACMLIGMPCSLSVFAAGSADSESFTMPFVLSQALLVPDSWNTGLDPDRSVSLHFTGNVTVDTAQTQAYISLVNAKGMADKVDPVTGASGSGIVTVWDATLSRSSAFGSINNYVVTLNAEQTRNAHELTDTVPEILALAKKTGLTPVVRLRETNDPLADGTQCANGKLLSVYENTTLLDATPNGLGDGGCNAAGQVILNASDNTVNGYDYVDVAISTVWDAPAIQYVEYDPNAASDTDFRIVLNNGLYYSGRGSACTPMHIRVVNGKGQVIYYNGKDYKTEDLVVSTDGVAAGYYALGNHNNAVTDTHGVNIQGILPQGSAFVSYSLSALPLPSWDTRGDSLDWTATYQTCLAACDTLNARNDGETYSVALVIDENDHSGAYPAITSQTLYAENGESPNNWRMDALWGQGYLAMPATHNNAALGINDRVIAPILASDEINEVMQNDPTQLTVKNVSLIRADGYADRVVVEFSKPLRTFSPAYAGLRVYAPQYVPSHGGTAMQWQINGWTPYDESGTRWMGTLNARFSCDTLTEIQQWLVTNNYATDNGTFAMSGNRRLEFAIVDNGASTKNNRRIDTVTAVDGSVLFANDSPFGTSEERAGVSWDAIDIYDSITIEAATVYPDKYVVLDFSQDVRVHTDLFFRALCVYDTVGNTLAGRNADKTVYGAHTLGVSYQRAFSSLTYHGERRDQIRAYMTDGDYEWLITEMEQANAWSVSQGGSASRFQLRLRLQDLANDLAVNIEYAIQGVSALDNDYSLLHTASGVWSTLYYNPSVYEHKLADLTDVTLQNGNQVVVSFSTEIRSADPTAFSLVYADGTTVNGTQASVNGTAVTVTFADAVFKDNMSLRIRGGHNYLLDPSVIQTVNGSVIHTNETVTTALMPCRISDAAAAADVNGTLYVEFANAWAAKQPGDTVTLHQDVTASYNLLNVPAGVTLDLNGHTLKSENILVFGDVIDSTNGNGLLGINKNDRAAFAILHSENDFLPLYDTAKTGYRFFSYDIVNRGIRTITADNAVTALKYGIGLNFANTDAYRLLTDSANADVQLTIDLSVHLPHANASDLIYTFPGWAVNNYASAVLNGTGNTLVIRIGGIEKIAAKVTDLPGNASIVIRSAVVSGTGVTLDSTQERYQIGITPAQAAVNWMRTHIVNKDLISFDYDGTPADLSQWSESISGNATTATADWTQIRTYTKDSVSLVLTYSFYHEHAALEWRADWSYSGSAYSKRISNIRILNAGFDINGAVMTTANQGGQNYVYDYQPYSVDLATTPSYTMQNSGGRSSQGAWPYFDLTSAHDTYGITGAIGWSGNWNCEFTYNAGTVNVSAGMQATDYQMKNGETLRSPSMVIQFFSGTQDDGHNAWRQLILDNYTPSRTLADGSTEKVTYAPIAISTWGGQGTDSMLATLNNIKDAGQYFEYQWIDAGWYGNNASAASGEGVWQQELGNWYYNPGYPNSSGQATDPDSGLYLTAGGFDALTQWHKQNGTGMIVWFEPGRAMADTQMGSSASAANPFTFTATYKATPSSAPTTRTVSWTNGYFLSGTAIVDYGNANALSFVKAVVLHYLDDMGCTYYRQDYNCNPANGWSNKDRKEAASASVARTGVAEIKYVMGHYELLDAIITSGRQIDNCASGGRLLDIEMMKRSIPLWRTDYTVSGSSVASGIRSQGANMSWWLPISGGSGSSQGINNAYGFRSYMGSGAAMSLMSNQTFATKMINELLRNRELMLGDYYILRQGLHEGLTLGTDTAHGNITCWLEEDAAKDYTDSVNAAYEFYREDLGKGYLVAFRPTHSDVTSNIIKLKGLDGHARYEVTDADSGQTVVYTGRYLMEQGLKLQFPTTCTSHMIYFTKR